MVKTQNKVDHALPPSAPPLFVTAFSEKGERREALIERDTEAPAWLPGSRSVRVQSPAGNTVMTDLQETGRDGLYEKLLDIVGGPDLAWAPVAMEGRVGEAKLAAARETIHHIELWVSGDEKSEVITGPLFALSSRRHDELNCIAVVHRTDHTTAYVPHAERFYIDLLPSAGGTAAVPMALVDTSLAGAFWGYSEHQAGDASRIAAGVLLARLFDGSVPQSPPWLAAAGHAVLLHREHLAAYGRQVRDLLKVGTVPEADADFLVALLGMAMLGMKLVDELSVRKDLRAALASLAKSRVTYGETLRLLDAKFPVMVEIARNELKDAELELEIRAISNWLSKAYVGGQVAAYAGDAPLTGSGWHDAFAQKKTPPIS